MFLIPHCPAWGAAGGQAGIDDLRGERAIGEPGIGGEDGEENGDEAQGPGGGAGARHGVDPEDRFPGAAFGGVMLVTQAGFFAHGPVAGKTNAHGGAEAPDEAGIVGFLAVYADDRALDMRHERERADSGRSGPARFVDHNFYIYHMQ